jgi:hypothetical protein
MEDTRRPRGPMSMPALTTRGDRNWVNHRPTDTRAKASCTPAPHHCTTAGAHRHIQAHAGMWVHRGMDTPAHARPHRTTAQQQAHTGTCTPAPHHCTTAGAHRYIQAHTGTRVHRGMETQTHRHTGIRQTQTPMPFSQNTHPPPPAKSTHANPCPWTYNEDRVGGLGDGLPQQDGEHDPGDGHEAKGVEDPRVVPVATHLVGVERRLDDLLGGGGHEK